MEKVVHAAGGVLWRPTERGIEVGLVHRPRYDDWSIPKGHVEPDENPVVAGLREIVEETGFQARLVRSIGKVAYDIPRRPRHGGGGATARKRVTYWSALAGPGEFTANDETDELRWVSVKDGSRLLSYPTDRRVLRKFSKQSGATATMLIVRHAKAGRKQGYRGADAARPLDKSGRAQAEALVDLCRAFDPADLLSAPPERCVQTLQPLAEDLGAEIQSEPTVSEAAYAKDPDAARQRVREIARAGEQSGRVPVLCSQGGVIPDLTARWSSEDGIRLPSARNRKASVWVLTTADGRMLSADYIDTPLPLVH